MPKPNTPLQSLIDEANRIGPTIDFKLPPPSTVTFKTGPRMSWEDTVHYIAQGAINISEGGCGPIERGSPVHRAMESFCDYMCKALVSKTKIVIPR